MWLKNLIIFSSRVIVAVTLLIHTIEASAVQPPQALNRANPSLLVPQPLTTAPSALQVTTSSQPNVTYNSSSNAYTHFERMDCDAVVYGVPRIPSCLEVYRSMKDDDELCDFGDRTRGVFQYPLPYRLTSTDGTCVIDIEALPLTYKDKATWAQLGSATLDLMDKCVFGKHSGGISTGLGKQGNLAITINTYKPDVDCQTSAPKFPDTRDCQALLSVMPTSIDEQWFGDKGEPGVDVGLPYDLAGPHGTCAFYFTSRGGLQRRTWHDLWEAATAVWAICGKDLEQGYAFVGNEKQSIDIAMYRPSEDAATNNSTIESLLRSHGDTATA